MPFSMLGFLWVSFVKHIQIRDSQNTRLLLMNSSMQEFRLKTLRCIIIWSRDAFSGSQNLSVSPGYYCPTLTTLVTVGKISHEKTRSQQLWLDLKEMLPTSDGGWEQTGKSDNNDHTGLLTTAWYELVSSLPSPPSPPPLPTLPHYNNDNALLYKVV